MTQQNPPRTTRQPAQLLISAGLLAIFIAAFVGASSWPTTTGLYPRVVSVAGIVLAAAALVGALRGSRPAAPEPTAAGDDAGPEGSAPAATPLDVADGHRADEIRADEDDADEHEADYVFAHAGARAWTGAVAWIAAFAIGLFVLGLYATILVFTIAYLRFSARTSWVLAVVYAVVAAGVLYLGAGLALHVPVPEGLLW